MKVGIVGINGGLGSHLAHLLRKHGNDVFGSDKGTVTTNEDVVRNAGVVVFAARPHTSAIIRELAPLARAEQLLIDVASLKRRTLEAMLASKADAVGLHPLFAPPTELNWRNRTVVVTRGRLREQANIRWLDSLLSFTGATVERVETAEAHDRHMAYSQNLVHAAILAVGSVLVTNQVRPADMQRFATTNSADVWRVHQRLLANRPEVIAELLCENWSNCGSLIGLLIRMLDQVRYHAGRHEVDAIVEIIKQQRAYFDEARPDHRSS